MELQIIFNFVFFYDYDISIFNILILYEKWFVVIYFVLGYFSIILIIVFIYCNGCYFIVLCGIGMIDFSDVIMLKNNINHFYDDYIYINFLNL